MSNSVQVDCVVSSVGLLMDSLLELNLATQDLRALEAAKRRMKNCNQEEVEIDYLLETESGEKIGIRNNAEGNVEFVVEKDTPAVKATIDKVTQAYARLKIINEVKKKGYQTVKEEKLANGSIRLVVEKWR